MAAECSLIKDENVTADPPRHGLNAKALLMQAAALAAEEAASMEENAPNTLSAHEQELGHLKSAFTTSNKLLTGIPKRETPIVAFVNQTKVSQARCVCVAGSMLQSPACNGLSRVLIRLVPCSADPSSHSAAGVAETGGSTPGYGSN